MDWITIGQDIISNSVSGIIVAAVCGGVGWFIYSTGIKGKDRDQKASERKNDIYIPLKYELKNIMCMRENIWKNIEVSKIKEIIEKNDELGVPEDIYKQCEILLDLIIQYNSIKSYTVAGNILSRRFEEKYLELYGATTHIEVHYDEVAEEKMEMEVIDYDIDEFRHIVDIQKNIDNIFYHSRYEEEYYNDMGKVGPIEEYLSGLFAMCLPKGDNKYNGIKFDKIKDKALIARKITPAEFMAKNFRFMQIFDESEEIQLKKQLFQQIQALSLEIYEDVIVRIRTITKKYEVE